MQQLKTITKTTTTKVRSVHMDTLYKLITNSYNNLEVVEHSNAKYKVARLCLFK